MYQNEKKMGENPFIVEISRAMRHYPYTIATSCGSNSSYTQKMHYILPAQCSLLSFVVAIVGAVFVVVSS